MYVNTFTLIAKEVDSSIQVGPVLSCRNVDLADTHMLLAKSAWLV